ncbi:hypothetical protein [Methanospirillum sp.]|uniref:hypothetical protein n=1 Tax=Methanospirillum sp. TaxID=45200 RepID=UPI0039C978DF
MTIKGIGLTIRGTLLTLLVMSDIVYWHRIGIEEIALVEQFRNEYIAYMKETKMLIPFIL